jgi:serine/threonine protein kinase
MFVVVQLDANGAIKLLADSQGRIPRPGTRSLAQTLRHQSPAFVDLVSSMLVWDPALRVTPAEAARHPWVVSPDALFMPNSTHSVLCQSAAAQQSQRIEEQAAHESAPHMGLGTTSAAGLHAMQMAQHHWQQHNLAMKSSEPVCATEVRINREPLAESGNTQPILGTSDQPCKRSHTQVADTGVVS